MDTVAIAPPRSVRIGLRGLTRLARRAGAGRIQWRWEWAVLPALLLVLGICGVGFWWLEPRAHTLGDGLWLAFTTAATVGYGDIVPSTPASKIFSVFVVLLGFTMLSLVTAAIAAMWVESQERRIEHEILRDLHRQVGGLRDEIAALRREGAQSRTRLQAMATTRDGATAAAAGRRRSASRRSRTAGR